MSVPARGIGDAYALASTCCFAALDASPMSRVALAAFLGVAGTVSIILG